MCWKHTADRSRLAHLPCKGDVFYRWAEREAALTGKGATDSTTHVLRITGPAVWCSICGAYATERAVGLAAPCRGRPPKGAEFGRHTKLARLRRGMHPKTGLPLDGPTWPDPQTILHEAEAATQNVLTQRVRVAFAMPMDGADSSAFSASTADSAMSAVAVTTAPACGGAAATTATDTTAADRDNNSLIQVVGATLRLDRLRSRVREREAATIGSPATDAATRPRHDVFSRCDERRWRQHLWTPFFDGLHLEWKVGRWIRPCGKETEAWNRRCGELGGAAL